MKISQTDKFTLGFATALAVLCFFEAGASNVAFQAGGFILLGLGFVWLDVLVLLNYINYINNELRIIKNRTQKSRYTSLLEDSNRPLKISKRRVRKEEPKIIRKKQTGRNMDGVKRSKNIWD